MSTKNSVSKESTDLGGSTSVSRSIEHGRFARALTPSMTAERDSEGLYRVESGDESYTVELGSAACDCPDHQYRGGEHVCKHAIRAALTEVLTERVSTEFVARVADFAREHGCPSGHTRLCDGPLGPRLPCPECMDGVRSASIDEGDVWTRVVTEDRA